MSENNPIERCVLSEINDCDHFKTLIQATINRMRGVNLQLVDYNENIQTPFYIRQSLPLTILTMELSDANIKNLIPLWKPYSTEIELSEAKHQSVIAHRKPVLKNEDVSEDEDTSEEEEAEDEEEHRKFPHIGLFFKSIINSSFGKSTRN